MDIFLGVIIPFIGTIIGSATVFLMKKELNNKIEKLLLGFAAGVMVASSIWSLIIPSIEMAKDRGVIGWLPASLGFVIGIIFLMIIEKLIPKLHVAENKSKKKIKKTSIMALAVTLHNIPEGLAVGVCFAGAISENSIMTIAGAIGLAIGIAIQNLPEGAIISIPLRMQGYTKTKAFLYGVLSGMVEPICAALTLLITNSVEIVLPYLLSFAAGTMIYVVVEELIPESKEEKNISIGTVGFTIGFLIMMIMDVALG